MRELAAICIVASFAVIGLLITFVPPETPPANRPKDSETNGSE